MSELSVIENIQAERTDLSLHVDLCAQRYNQLINKFDEVDLRLNQLTDICREIKETLTDVRSNTQSTYLRWAGGIIIILAGLLGGVINHLVS